MSHNNEAEFAMDGGHNSWEQPWPCKEILGTLTELNELCLELLAEQAMQPVPAAPPMLRELADLWSQLNSTSRKRAAACPYLLIDAGFSDPYRWQWVAGQENGITTAYRISDREAIPYAATLSGPTATRVAHQVFSNSWYIVQTQPIGAPFCLGMPSHCATLLRACTLRQVNDLANQHTAWLRPRWPGRVKLWRNLLESALWGDLESLQMARNQGRTLLAMELKAMDRLKGMEAMR